MQIAARSGKHLDKGLTNLNQFIDEEFLLACFKTLNRIFDVAVDLRVGAPSFGHWVGTTLDADAGESLWIPPGFAHGYLVLSDVADVHYKVTEEYRPDLDRGVLWNDPAIGVEWPVAAPIVSAKDREQPTLASCDNPFRA
jgi:dTDP-4-dehydrorhamnose 3,5-epimerase